MVAASQPGRRPSSQEQQDQRSVLDGASEPAVAFPPPRGCERRNVSVFKTSSTAKPPDEIDIFHQRPVRVAPDLTEDLASREQGLVSVGEPEQPDPEPDAMLDPSSPASARIERETKAAANDRTMIFQQLQQ